MNQAGTLDDEELSFLLDVLNTKPGNEEDGLDDRLGIQQQECVEPLESNSSQVEFSAPLPYEDQTQVPSNKSGKKMCMVQGCGKLVQSKQRCKKHGGGSRCNVPGCDKLSQGGGYCRKHGGGSACMHPRCTKGSQKRGYCATHGGSDICIYPDCGNRTRSRGYCATHGGGTRCKHQDCNLPARKLGFCRKHLNQHGKAQGSAAASYALDRS